GNKKGIEVISALNEKYKNDEYVESIEYPQNLSINVIKNPYGLAKLNGLYCINKIIKKLGITEEEFINNPVEAIRKYSLATTNGGAFGPIKDSFDSLFLNNQVENDLNKDPILAGAIDYLATLDSKNINENLAVLSNEIAFNEKAKSVVVANDIDNIKAYSNILLSDDKTTLNDINNRNLLSEIVNDKSKLPSSASIMANFNKMKLAIYNNYNILNNPTQEQINAASNKLELLIAAALNSLHTVRILNRDNELLKREFDNNQEAMKLIDGYVGYLSDLPENEAIFKNVRLDGLNTVYNHISSDPDKIYSNAKNREDNSAKDFDLKLTELLNRLDTIATNLSNSATEAEINDNKELYNAIDREITELKTAELNRLADELNSGNLPLSYVKARIKQIKSNQPIGNLKINLNEVEKLAFAQNIYLIQNSIIEKSENKGKKIVEEELALPIDVIQFNIKDYDTKLTGNSNDITVIKVKDAIDKIESFNDFMDDFDDLTKASAVLKIRMAKNQLIMGYLAGSKGAELDAKVQVFQNANVKRRINKMITQARKLALEKEISLIRTADGKPAIKLDDYEAAVAEATRLGINVNDVVNNVELSFDTIMNDDYLNQIYEEFKTNPNLADLDTRIINDYDIDADNIRQFDSDRYIEKVITYTSSSYKILQELDANQSRKIAFVSFINNANALNKYSSRIAKTATNFFDIKVKEEARARAALKTNARKEATKDLGEISVHHMNFDNDASLEISENSRASLLSLYRLSTKIDVGQYGKKCASLKAKLADLYQKNSELIKHPTPDNMETYFNALKEINGITNQIKELDNNIRAFADKSKELTSDIEFMPSFSMENVNSSGYTHKNILESAKLRAQLDIFKAVKKICEENNVNPEDLFNDKSKETFNKLINSLTNKMKDEYLVKSDDDILTAYRKLHSTKNDDYLKSKEYNDINNLCDFITSMDPTNSKKSLVTTEYIKTKVKHEIAEEITNTNIINNSARETFANLLVRKPGDDTRKLVFNHELNSVLSSYYKDNVNSSKVISKANEQEFNLELLAHNYEALKRSIIEYSKKGITPEAQAQHKLVATTELNALTMAFYNTISDYFLMHPEKLADRNLKTFKSYYENPRKLVTDSFKKFAPVDESLVDNLEYYKEDLNNKYEEEKTQFFDRLNNDLRNLTLVNSEVNKNPESELVKEKFQNELYKVKLHLYQDVKAGRIPVSFYDDAINKLVDDGNGSFLRIRSTFDDEQEKEVKRNIWFRDKNAFIDVNVPAPKAPEDVIKNANLNAVTYLLNRPGAERVYDNNQIIINNRENIHIDIEDKKIENNNINNIINEDIQIEKENDLIIDTSSNKNKVHIDLGENVINEPKSQKVEENNKNKVINKDVIDINKI
nr:hypothetical protein [Acholeplasmatales bacterium]